jgi:acyl-CoA thioester hydrolase
VSRTNRTELRVMYADTDAMGVVYHANYIKWFERGRAELFRDAGVTHARLEAAQLYLPVSQAYCHYYASARYDQIVVLETQLAYMKNVSMKFLSVVKDRDDGRLLASGYTVHGCTDHAGRIARIPADIAADLRALLADD